jgi:translocation protein SEC66
MVNIGHLMETQSKRQTIQSLVQAGSLSEDVWQTFSDAERFMNDEMQTIIEEAELMKTGWGKVIVRQAHELLQAEMAKQTAAQEAEADQISKQRAESDLKEREAAAAKAAKELLAEEEREGKKVK